MDVLLKDSERIDDLQCKGYRIIQNENGFCFGCDAVLLANYAKLRRGEKAVDLGTGTGIIPLLLSAKTEAESILGIEYQEQVAEMAERSVLLNDIQDRVHILKADICNIRQMCRDRILKADGFDVVLSNPPYMDGRGLKSETDMKLISRHEICCRLHDVTAAASMLLKTRGRFYMVHRAQRLAEIIRELSAVGLEPKRLRMVYPYQDKEANLVLIEAVKGAKPQMIVEPPLIMYERPGVYTQEVMNIYQSGSEESH